MKKIKKITFPQYGECKTYPEKFVIGNLLNNSNEFKSFYQTEREKIKGQVYWAQSQLLAGTAGMATPLADGNNVIVLPIVPVPLEGAFTVAHEMGHLLRRWADNNFGITGTDSKSFEHASFINSMIEDRLVDSILIRYGFDLKAEYESYLRKQMTETKSSTYFLDEIDALTGFTNFKLRCDLIGEDFATWRELETLLESKFPHLADGVNSLYCFVRENEKDIHTSEKKKQLMRLILTITARYPARSNLRTR